MVLEIGPSAANSELPLPTIDLPIAGRYTTAPTVDGGVAAGPTLSLMGENQLGVQLPIGPTQLVSISGTVLAPSSQGVQPLQSAEVAVTCAQTDGGTYCPQGYSYRLVTVTGVNGSGPGGFELQVPPNASYNVTATPPPGLGLAPVSVPLVSVPDGGITLVVPTGFVLSGTVFDPTGSVAISSGQVQVTSLTTGALVGTTDLQSNGSFQLILPPGPYVVLVQPAASTGLPNLSQAVSLVGDVELGNLSLYRASRLGGGVFAVPLDGGAYPVAQASLQFYFVIERQAFGTVALPIASGITDQEGHFSVAVPSATAPASN
jgi:hypothetical protein